MTQTHSRGGLIYKARYYLLRVSEKYNEFRFGIRSDGRLTPDQLGLTNPDSIEYAPVPYRVLRKIFNTVLIREHEDVFLDMGCGMGRPLVIAAQYPFRRILGVEISAELCAVASKNIARIRDRARCQDIGVIHADATHYTIPDDVTVIFFANPFRGETLHKVVENVRQSLLRNPRLLKIVYFNRVFFEEEAAGKKWIQKRFQLPCFPRAGWALYEADGRAVELLH